MCEGLFLVEERLSDFAHTFIGLQDITSVRKLPRLKKWNTMALINITCFFNSSSPNFMNDVAE